MKGVKRILVGIVVAVMPFLTGCYATTSMTKNLQNSDKIHASSKSQRLPAAYITSIKVTVDDAAVNMNPAFEQRFVDRVQEAKLFSDVVSNLGREKRTQESHYELMLKVNEKFYKNSFGNGIKAFFTGVTLFLLTPVLPMTYEFESEMTLKILTPRSKVKDYKASELGSLVCTLPDCREGVIKLEGEVTERCITSLMNQLVQDDRLTNPQ